MKLRTTKFFLKEGLSSLRKNKIMTAASITSVIAALLVIGIFLIVVLNIDYAASALESQIEIMVYLEDGLSENIITAMNDEINKLNGVKDILFVSKHTALKNLEQKWGENAYLLEGLDEENPLPDTFVITLTDPVMASSVALSVSSISNVQKVMYWKEELDNLLKATYLVRMASLFIIVTLLFISMFIISNTIKLTVYARRKEIGIMKFVGATDWFVRGPFIFEGIILGVLGGIVSIGLLGSGYLYCVRVFEKEMIGLMSIRLMPFEAAIIPLGTLLLSIGVVIGIVGSLLSVRRFIRV